MAIRGDLGSIIDIDGSELCFFSVYLGNVSQLKAVAGKHSSEIRKILGPARRDVVAIPEDIVIVDY